MDNPASPQTGRNFQIPAKHASASPIAKRASNRGELAAANGYFAIPALRKSPGQQQGLWVQPIDGQQGLYYLVNPADGAQQMNFTVPAAPEAAATAGIPFLAADDMPAQGYVLMQPVGDP